MRILQFLAIVVVLGTSLPLGLAQDPSPFGTLYTFTGGNDGANPYAGLTLRNEAIYGTTLNGGTGNAGTVFSLTPPASPGGAWTETVLHAFTGGSDGSGPYGDVVFGKYGIGLYGTTEFGGAGDLGTVFSLAPPASPGGAWTETSLYSFSNVPYSPNGAFPTAGVVIGKNGGVYGTTPGNWNIYYGCTVPGCGTVFLLNPPVSPGGAWTEDVLYFFGSGGSVPNGVVIDTSGVLYGTTSGFSGTVFSLTLPASPGSRSTVTVLYSFTGGPFGGGSDDGGNPSAGVVIDGSGVLYGTTEYGGTGTACSGGCGTVFSLTPPATPGGAWTETVLHSFAGGSDGAYPEVGVVIGKNGGLFGTTASGGTSNDGTVFSLARPARPGGAWTETVLHDFTGGSDGSNPNGVAISENGGLFGTTRAGGTGTCGCGTVFALKP